MLLLINSGLPSVLGPAQVAWEVRRVSQLPLIPHPDPRLYIKARFRFNKIPYTRTGFSGLGKDISTRIRKDLIVIK